MTKVEFDRIAYTDRLMQFWRDWDKQTCDKCNHQNKHHTSIGQLEIYINVTAPWPMRCLKCDCKIDSPELPSYE